LKKRFFDQLEQAGPAYGSLVDASYKTFALTPEACVDMTEAAVRFEHVYVGGLWGKSSKDDGSFYYPRSLVACNPAGCVSLKSRRRLVKVSAALV
jgi:hypothetical protein